MAEREKVIDGLNCHVKGDCAECPYREGWHTCNPTLESGLFADAIALLKAQEPVKPIHDQDVYPDGSVVVDLYFCGACEDEIEQGQKYCCNCGRPVKWIDKI